LKKALTDPAMYDRHSKPGGAPEYEKQIARHGNYDPHPTNIHKPDYRKRAYFLHLESEMRRKTDHSNWDAPQLIANTILSSNSLTRVLAPHVKKYNWIPAMVLSHNLIHRNIFEPTPYAVIEEEVEVTSFEDKIFTVMLSAKTKLQRV